MPTYMTQALSSGTLPKKTYFRQQSAHPSHDESGAFTQDAIANYATFNHISPHQVEVGAYQSGQGRPNTNIGYFEI